MMKATLITRCLMVASLASSLPTAQAAGTWFEARNDAMGGTGVASSKYGAAPLLNPALLTKSGPSDDISIILPAVGAQVSDPDNLQDGFDNVKHTWDNLENTTGTGHSASSAADLRKSLTDISGHSGRADAGVGAMIAVPNATLPFALVIKGWGQAKAHAVVSDSDLTYLDAASTGLVQPDDSTLNNLTSRAEGVAALISEYGIAMAHPFTLGKVPVSVGITPKFQRVDTWNYNVAINNYSTSDFHSGDWQRSKSGANVDLGFSADLTPEWTVALAVQNLVARSVDTREVNGLQDSFNIRPQATAGTAWSNGLVTFAADIDMTPASGFASDEKRQYASIGAELNAWSWAQLRAGYRADMRNSGNNVVTAGIGISPLDVVHLDLTGMAGTDRTYGAVAQLSVTF
ncbi:conjugal transfer protein TraF [Prodigiosinella confusarubida]|uniref:Conjugal transfer protein TraF n=2 Tax=Serratia sp. (strain ATCC 39006) TaxID=104623 RepID=A0A2I5TBB7_SERS3|nr:conjugal transfer protein TraF [Serratia sp. ATCC 39006]AUH06167.1 conjugal transfer protein TraF [Serratia sp. ATCC 39006]